LGVELQTTTLKDEKQVDSNLLYSMGESIPQVGVHPLREELVSLTRFGYYHQQNKDTDYN
jgi:hypothetical protein